MSPGAHCENNDTGCCEVLWLIIRLTVGGGAGSGVEKYIHKIISEQEAAWLLAHMHKQHDNKV